jgi:hypothetical protein
MRNTKADVRNRVRSTGAFPETTLLELALLDAATKRAQQDIEAALRAADMIVADHQRFLRRMRAIRKTLPARFVLRGHDK